MKKILKFMILALVAMCGFASCSEECDHKFIADDHSADLVGTWTCLQADFAEALVISADGKVVSTGVAFGEYWENVQGTVKVENNRLTMIFEDHDNYEGHFDIIPGMAFTVYNDEGRRFTYNYCKEDLSDEIVGMWVCTQTPSGKAEDMLIQDFQKDGKLITTGKVPEVDDFVVVGNSTYKVFGDLYMIYGEGEREVAPLVFKFNVASNATGLGDMMTVTGFMQTENGVVEATSPWLRIKEGLSFNAKPYAYNTAYISNVKGGKDEDFSILGHPFNMANVKAGDFDMLFHSELFCVDLKENHIKQLFRANGQDIAIDIPITVEGNKVTLHMGTEDTKLQDVEMYMFQDADACQLHMYMHTDAFINYFANMEVISLQVEGKIGSTQAEIDAVYANMKARIEAINVSFVFKAIK
ncbi:MAG: hypothetical protein IKY31_00305 [Bacteroidaceae bacterium]|nr:hypothetical protein [Bacteroidaceae bacterium]